MSDKKNEAGTPQRCQFEIGLTNLINAHGMENGSNTPDFILAKYLMACLGAFVETTNTRSKWYGCDVEPASSKVCSRSLAMAANRGDSAE